MRVQGKGLALSSVFENFLCPEQHSIGVTIIYALDSLKRATIELRYIGIVYLQYSKGVKVEYLDLLCSWLAEA